ncbi:hypothetical protein [Sulfobacillus sp. hq2]|nr:hypothetical protein [Sulfobacillus sp. hq2]
MKFTVGDMVKVGLIAFVFIWLMKWIFKMINIPGISSAVEGV